MLEGLPHAAARLRRSQRERQRVPTEISGALADLDIESDDGQGAAGATEPAGQLGQHQRQRQPKHRWGRCFNNQQAGLQLECSSLSDGLHTLEIPVESVGSLEPTTLNHHLCR